jgi:hypothetical protein
VAWSQDGEYEVDLKAGKMGASCPKKLELTVEFSDIATNKRGYHQLFV